MRCQLVFKNKKEKEKISTALYQSHQIMTRIIIARWINKNNKKNKLEGKGNELTMYKVKILRIKKE